MQSSSVSCTVLSTGPNGPSRGTIARSVARDTWQPSTEGAPVRLKSAVSRLSARATSKRTAGEVKRGRPSIPSVTKGAFTKGGTTPAEAAERASAARAAGSRGSGSGSPAAVAAAVAAAMLCTGGTSA